MTLVHPAPPADGLDVLIGVLQELFDDGSLIEKTPFAAVAPEKLSAAEPHRRYTIGLGKLAGGAFLDEVKVHGWEYLLLQDDVAVGALELTNEHADGTLGFRSLTMARFATGFLAAHKIAEALPQVASGTYELRMFEVPSLPFCSLWLHPETTGREDLFVPVPPNELGLDPTRAYTVAELLPILQPAAKTTELLHKNTERLLAPPPAAAPPADAKEQGGHEAGAS